MRRALCTLTTVGFADRMKFEALFLWPSRCPSAMGLEPSRGNKRGRATRTRYSGLEHCTLLFTSVDLRLFLSFTPTPRQTQLPVSRSRSFAYIYRRCLPCFGGFPNIPSPLPHHATVVDTQCRCGRAQHHGCLHWSSQCHDNWQSKF